MPYRSVPRCILTEFVHLKVILELEFDCRTSCPKIFRARLSTVGNCRPVAPRPFVEPDYDMDDIQLTGAGTRVGDGTGEVDDPKSDRSFDPCSTKLR